MRKQEIGLALGVVFLLSGIVATGIGQSSSAPSEEAIRQLMVQRRDILRQVLEVTKASYLVGNVDHESVFKAINNLLAAELELADTNSARIALHESRVENLKSMEELFEKRFGLGHIEKRVVLAASAERMQAEIDLMRARLSETGR